MKKKKEIVQKKNTPISISLKEKDYRDLEKIVFYILVAKKKRLSLTMIIRNLVENFIKQNNNIIKHIDNMLNNSDESLPHMSFFTKDTDDIDDTTIGLIKINLDKK
jgi:hypothetical protein